MQGVYSVQCIYTVYKVNKYSMYTVCTYKSGQAYLIFVIFFTQAKFLKNKIYTEIYTVNCQFTQ